MDFGTLLAQQLAAGRRLHLAEADRRRFGSGVIELTLSFRDCSHRELACVRTATDRYGADWLGIVLASAVDGLNRMLAPVGTVTISKGRTTRLTPADEAALRALDSITFLPNVDFAEQARAEAERQIIEQFLRVPRMIGHLEPGFASDGKQIREVSIVAGHPWAPAPQTESAALGSPGIDHDGAYVFDGPNPIEARKPPTAPEPKQETWRDRPPLL